MILVRVLATIAVFAAAAALIYYFCYLPVLSTNATFHLEASTTRTERLTEDYRITVRARRDFSRALTVAEQHPIRASLYIIAARNADLLGRKDDALALTHRALEFDRRPGLLLYAGTLHCALGNRDLAVQYLTAACLFDPRKRYLIPGNCIVPEAIAAAEEREATLRAGGES